MVQVCCESKEDCVQGRCCAKTPIRPKCVWDITWELVMGGAQMVRTAKTWVDCCDGGLLSSGTGKLLSVACVDFQMMSCSSQGALHSQTPQAPPHLHHNCVTPLHTTRPATSPIHITWSGCLRAVSSTVKCLNQRSPQRQGSLCDATFRVDFDILAMCRPITTSHTNERVYTLPDCV